MELMGRMARGWDDGYFLDVCSLKMTLRQHAMELFTPQNVQSNPKSKSTGLMGWP